METLSLSWISSQASIQKNIPIYKAAVKNSLEVRIDQENFLPSDV